MNSSAATYRSPASVMASSEGGPVFIVGYPRSGTTLIRAVLSAHGQIRLTDEPELIWALRAVGIGVDERVTLTAETVRRLNAMRAHRDDIVPIDAGVVNPPKIRSFRELYELLLPKPTDIAVWGEKSLNNIFFLKQIREMYASALLIDMVRDPRSALLSYFRKKAFDDGAQVVADARTINFFIYRSMQWSAWRKIASAEHGGARALRFEDLVAEPAQQVKSIIQALGLVYDEQMLDETRRQNDRALTDSSAFAHQRLGQPIDAARASTGKTLPSWATSIVQRYCGAEMSRCGYEPADDYVPLGMRGRIRMQIAWAERRYRRELKKHLTSRLWQDDSVLADA